MAEVTAEGGSTTKLRLLGVVSENGRQNARSRWQRSQLNFPARTLTLLRPSVAKSPLRASTRRHLRQRKSRRLCRYATRPSTPACRPRKSCPAWQPRGGTWPLSRAFTGCSKSTVRSTAEAKRSHPKRWPRPKCGWPMGSAKFGAGTSRICLARCGGSSCARTWYWTCSAG